jgi:serine/threonine protein kinase
VGYYWGNKGTVHPVLLLEKCEGSIEIPENGVDELTAIPWLMALATAVSSMHAANVIHNDIKPGNILMGLDGLPKLCDFGGAVDDVKPGQYVIGAGECTPIFCAPESLGLGYGSLGGFLNGAYVISHASDWYSLGLVFFNILTGKLHTAGCPPTREPDIKQALRRDTYRKFMATTLSDHGTSPALTDLIMGMTEFDPGDRCTSSAVLDRLRYSSQSPVGGI